jgi:Protein of unknown function (DUF3102)
MKKKKKERQKKKAEKALLKHDSDAVLINKVHESVAYGSKILLIYAIKCGQLLAAKKKKVGHGNWLKWCEINLSFSQDTVCRYIKMHENKDAIEKEFGDTARLTAAYHFVKDSRIKPGAIQADKKRMLRDLITPIKIVRSRFSKLPWTPIYWESLMEIRDIAIEELKGLLEELNSSEFQDEKIIEEFKKEFRK